MWKDLSIKFSFVTLTNDRLTSDDRIDETLSNYFFVLSFNTWKEMANLDNTASNFTARICYSEMLEVKLDSKNFHSFLFP